MRVYLILLSALLAINALVTLWAMWRMSAVLEVFHAAGDLVEEVRRTRASMQKLRDSLGPLFGGPVGTDNPIYPVNAAGNFLKDWKT